jgi:hypothetical protein
LKEENKVIFVIPLHSSDREDKGDFSLLYESVTIKYFILIFSIMFNITYVILKLMKFYENNVVTSGFEKGVIDFDFRLWGSFIHGYR